MSGGQAMRQTAVTGSPGFISIVGYRVVLVVLVITVADMVLKPGL